MIRKILNCDGGFIGELFLRWSRLTINNLAPYDLTVKISTKVQAYLFDGYWEDIGTIEAFYNANLGITKKPVPDFR